jgi:antirestriction protein ArdC
MATRKKTTTKKARKDVYEMVTNKIIDQLNKGVIPWRRTWKQNLAPMNGKTRRPYSGINAFLLACSGYDSPYWLTFKQAKELGGSVKKGEKSTQVVFWSILKKEDENGKEKKIFFLRYYNVFNVEQTEDVKLPKKSAELVDLEPQEEFEADARCEIISSEYLTRENIALHHGGDRACYAPHIDSITMPQPDRFDSAPAYYSTLYHEMIHSTGHANRLARKGITEFDKFGSEQYADEELVAEFGASFLCAVSGIEREDTIENTAAYIAGWKKKLKDDPKLVVYAASRAQKAADFVMDANEDEEGDSESPSNNEAQTEQVGA